MVSLLFPKAMLIGVAPSWSACIGEAPYSSNFSVVEACPFLTAKCRGVLDASSVTLTLAPRCKSLLTSNNSYEIQTHMQ